jgi:hypothetical protein
MERKFIADEVNTHFEPVKEVILALKFAKEAIPRDGTPVDGAGIYALINVLTESLNSAVDVSKEELIEYMSSWKD